MGENRALERIVIVEDHGLMAHTLAGALSASGWIVDVVELTPDAEVLPTIQAALPDLVLLDLDLGPWGDATDAIPALADDGVQVLVVTGIDDPVRHARCVAAGAAGVVRKASGFDHLVAAITRTLRDGSLLTRHEREEHLGLLREHERAERRRLAPFEALSRREAEILGDLMAGQTVAAIAVRSYVSVGTVRTHVRAILRKLGAHSQVQAIGMARDAGWRPPQERVSHA